MSVLLDNQEILVWHAAEDFEQTLKFSYQKERTLPNGTKALYAFRRSIQIGYVGVREGVHKFQLAVTKTELSLTRMAEPTAELSRDLHQALSLLVLGADKHGNLVEIYNLPYVQYTWAALKEEFLRDYDQEEYLVLIHEMDKHIASENTLLAYLQLPTMFGLYFNGCWHMDANTHEMTKQVMYGKELADTILDESVTFDTNKNETQIQVCMHSTLQTNEHSNARISIQHYSGTCIYVDGVLDTCKKAIQLDSTKFYYSAKWGGLKQLFQQL
jgi:hypothetical protein